MAGSRSASAAAPVRVGTTSTTGRVSCASVSGTLRRSTSPTAGPVRGLAAGDARDHPVQLCHRSCARRSSVVGRQAELAVLVGLLGSPSGGAVFVHGEAGIGKSRLVRELTAQARAAVRAGARRARGTRSTPDALPAAGRGAGRGVPPVGTAAGAGAGAFRPVLGRLVPEWHRLDLAGQLTSTVVLGEGVLRMIQALAGGGRALLVVEDLHWADPETLDVLGYLAGHATEAGLVCVVTGRPEPGAGLDLMGELAARRVVLPVELRPLTVRPRGRGDGPCLPADARPTRRHGRDARPGRWRAVPGGGAAR